MFKTSLSGSLYLGGSIWDGVDWGAPKPYSSISTLWRAKADDACLFIYYYYTTLSATGLRASTPSPIVVSEDVIVVILGYSALLKW